MHEESNDPPPTQSFSFKQDRFLILQCINWNGMLLTILTLACYSPSVETNLSKFLQLMLMNKVPTVCFAFSTFLHVDCFAFSALLKHSHISTLVQTLADPLGLPSPRWPKTNCELRGNGSLKCFYTRSHISTNMDQESLKQAQSIQFIHWIKESLELTTVMQIEANSLQFLSFDSKSPQRLKTLPTTSQHNCTNWKLPDLSPAIRVQPQVATLLLSRHGEKTQAHRRDDELGPHKRNGQR